LVFKHCDDEIVRAGATKSGVMPKKQSKKLHDGGDDDEEAEEDQMIR
jgi:hypothetical protein